MPMLMNKDRKVKGLILTKEYQRMQFVFFWFEGYLTTQRDILQSMYWFCRNWQEYKYTPFDFPFEVILPFNEESCLD